VKYALLKSGIGGDVIFDFDQSVSFEGASGPYLQYTYARTVGVSSKAQEKITGIVLPESDLNQEELGVLKHIAKYAETVTRAAAQKAPNVMADYLFDLAQKYNVFYNKHQILGAGNEKFRLGLNVAVGQVIRTGLGLLGIEAVEKM
jgi:arginyl-tRNA synthetase